MDNLPKLALSIRQPWAHCIMHLGKDIENRNWHTNLRGRICLHAAKGMTRDEYDEAMETIRHVHAHRPFAEPPIVPGYGTITRGGIIGTVEIVDCVTTSESPWFFGRFGFVLRNPQPVSFVPVKGALGFFDWRKRMEA
ncbi:ASCH domain-containing protein [uncultured Martelella sp.]|uniref:ASCH domain-containing protein n=1 Tax=uncultured Martelella sp. TaxID=392331 RepID=UPI0029C71DA4|nr:ASCH domain-containing protein [uncultured Martelella sp.]